MIGLLKKPLSICQSGWREIQNALPVIRRVRWRPTVPSSVPRNLMIWLPNSSNCLPVTVFVGISHDALEKVQEPSGFLSAAHFWRFKQKYYFETSLPPQSPPAYFPFLPISYRWGSFDACLCTQADETQATSNLPHLKKVSWESYVVLYYTDYWLRQERISSCTGKNNGFPFLDIFEYLKN